MRGEGISSVKHAAGHAYDADDAGSVEETKWSPNLRRAAASKKYDISQSDPPQQRTAIDRTSRMDPPSDVESSSAPSSSAGGVADAFLGNGVKPNAKRGERGEGGEEATIGVEPQ